MSDPIYADAIWEVHRLSNPLQVRFIKRQAGRPGRLLLDQVAEWDRSDRNWSPHHWRPTSPVIPHWLNAIVRRACSA